MLNQQIAISYKIEWLTHCMSTIVTQMMVMFAGLLCPLEHIT